MLTTIEQNLTKLYERINTAAQRAGRNPDDITLVGVTKTHPAEIVLAALEAGLQHVGENRVEELEAKRPAVHSELDVSSPQPVWHMIGHIQSRKAALAAQNADFIHSVDSLKLARRLDRFAAEVDKVLPVLLEVNLSGEESKYGWPADRWDTDPQQWTDLQALVEQVGELDHLQLRGLMTMAPWVMDEAVIRPVFRSARLLLEQLAATFPKLPWQHLSMGMTDDFQVAIEEGATIIRVGRAIFGARAAR